jgi:outer membrane protein assembly factor BamA
VRVAPALTLEGGVELNRLQLQYPRSRIEWANAIFGELKADHRWETGGIRHRFEAGYRATATTDGLDSDFSYTQHRGGAMYRLRAGDEELRVRFNAGAVNGRAPLYARFNLGNLDTLRGWSQYDVAPLGGNRMAHGSLEYRHDWFWTWYDTGAVYDRGSPGKVRHSVGLGIRSGREFEFGAGFPIRSGSINPVFFIRVGW